MATSNDYKLIRYVAKAALQKMYTQGHFSICTIDNLIKLTNSVPDPLSYQLLHALHCVDYKNMDKLVRDELPKLIARCLNFDGFDEEVFIKVDTDAVPEKPRSFIQRFLP